MPARRILSLWFPRLGAERLLRQRRALAPSGPLVTLRDQRGAQVLASLSTEASAAGLAPGQPLRDARAMCPDLVAVATSPHEEAAFLGGLRRWAGKFSPWVGEVGGDGLVLDITGVAHLFGGEAGLVAQLEEDGAALGLSLRLGLADTLGAAWALARFAGAPVGGGEGGDAIDQEARATRSRAARAPRPPQRPWGQGTTPPGVTIAHAPPAYIAAPGATRAAIAPLPVAALRLSEEVVAALNKVGIRRISELLELPRAGLARRYGRDLVLRLDQALGAVGEPISPARAPLHFAVRLRLPEPIGLHDDLLAGLKRLLTELTRRLKARGRAARTLRLELSRVDATSQAISATLARASTDAARILPLLAMKLDEVDAGFGIDQMRLLVPQHEPHSPQQHRGPVGQQERGAGMDADALADLIGRIGARLGLEALTRLAPAASHIPEKAELTLAAAWSEPSRDWNVGAEVGRHGEHRPPRPLLLWRPEPIDAPAHRELPARFRWRGREHAVVSALGPERIAPEWWLAEAEWRSGVRDYWQVVTREGAKLWLFFAHGAALSPGWFCHGAFA